MAPTKPADHQAAFYAKRAAYLAAGHGISSLRHRAPTPAPTTPYAITATDEQLLQAQENLLAQVQEKILARIQETLAQVQESVLAQLQDAKQERIRELEAENGDLRRQANGKAGELWVMNLELDVARLKINDFLAAERRELKVENAKMRKALQNAKRENGVAA